jgi:hypothetical protein
MGADEQDSAHLRMLGYDRAPQAAKGDVRFFQDAFPDTVPLALFQASATRALPSEAGPVQTPNSFETELIAATERRFPS